MQKIITMKKLQLFICILALCSCESIVDDIDKNPNSITVDQIEPQQVLPAAMVANTLVQVGHLQRISGLYSGQYKAYQSLYLNIYSYNITSEESESTWNRAYINVLPQLRYIRENVPDNRLLVGITGVLEAQCIGSIASFFGDVPYSQASNPEVEDPTFDGQEAVLNGLIGLLDQSISDLNAAASKTLAVDIYHGGDKDKWIAAANTLKARYYMLLRNYGAALTAAQNGITSSEDDMLFVPVGADGVAGSKNTFWTILNGSRTGDIGSRETYLIDLLDPANSESRNNAKTDENARFLYYQINDASSSGNMGVVNEFEPQPLVTYRENQLILAEAAARSQGFDAGLQALNDYRAYLNDGGYLNANFASEVFKYEPYDASDFAAGGMENADNISPDAALLREIVEEAYVSGYMSITPFDLVRRVRGEGDISIPFPTNTPTETRQPERLIYPTDELRTNSNAPAEPGLFTKTPVNQ